MKNIPLFLLTACFSLLITNCSPRVNRVDASETIDLSGRWNDTDSQLTAEELTGQALSGAWITNFQRAHQKQPVVIVGMVANKTSEHIDSETFILEIERAFINSGRVRLVQGGEKRNELRSERADQQDYASLETMKEWGREVGADYMMQGTISSIIDQEGRQKVVFYQISLEMSDLETNEIAWIGNKKIKKYIAR